MTDHSAMSIKNDKTDSHTLTFYAVTDGEIVPIEQVEDEVFAQKMIGNGFALKPTSQTVVAPISGRLIEVAETKHAYYIEIEQGIKVLIHVGLDTLLLNGEGLNAKVEKNSFINVGDPLVTFDKELFEQEGYYTTIPIIVLDNKERKMEFTLHTTKHAQAGKTKALDITF